MPKTDNYADWISMFVKKAGSPTFLDKIRIRLQAILSVFGRKAADRKM